MILEPKRIVIVFALPLLLFACSKEANPPVETAATTALPPEPVVTHTSSDAQPGQRIEHGEVIADVDEARKQLHAQHHPRG